jgi:starch synthase
MNDTLSVLVVSPEVAPLAQTGGLAEVAGTLPLALNELGCRVAVAMPAYHQVMQNRTDLEVAARDIPVRVGDLYLTAQVLQAELAPGVPLFLVQRDEYFDRSGIYGGYQGDYFDNPERFIFFSRAIPAMCPGVGFVPDVILANDWESGLVMVMLDLGALPRTAGVFSIHNQGYLGLVPAERRHIIGIPDRYYGIDGLEYFGQMSLLKAGIMYSQAVTTVSPTYAQEIQTPEGGQGLDGAMRAVNWKLRGILNGVDYHVWNPAADPHIAAQYSIDDLAGKALCKQSLLEEMGLAHLKDAPIIGMVTRLTSQKGFNLVAEASEDIFKAGAGLIVLGAGEPWHEDQLKKLKELYPDRVAMRIGYDPPLAHQIIAGCDMLLMPSMYEPCGLAQMYALKYGAIPLVRAVGGLNDTIRDPGDGTPATGFKFGSFQARALARAVRRAVEVFGQPETWKEMMVAGMKEDFSWGRSAREYLSVFEWAIDRRRSR